MRFKALIDSLLESFLADLGVSTETFLEVVSQNSDELSTFIFQFVAGAEDFTQFRAMMTKSNLTLDDEVCCAV